MKKIYLIIFAIILASISYFYIGLNKDNNKTINLYSARKEKFIAAVIQEFTQETGIKVNLLVDKAPKLLAKLESEKQNTPADLLFTSDIINIEKAKEEGLLQPLKNKKIKSLVNNSYIDDDNYWVGISRRARLIFYNNKLFSAAPQYIKNYQDLASDLLDDAILIRSSSNAYNQALVSAMIAHYGSDKTEEILEDMIDNLARKPQGGDTDQLKALAKGIGKVAVANDYYYRRMLHSDDEIIKSYVSDISVIYPNQDTSGYHVNISAIAITKYSKNTKAAQKFIEFLLSQKSQEYFAENNFETSVNLDSKSDIPYKADIKTLKNLYKHANTAIDIADEIEWK